MSGQPDISLRTPLCDLLGCDLPILLAGMGGVSRWELAAAVANAGGYGMLGMVREDPDLIAQEVMALRAATDRPFAVNLIPAATEPGLLDAQISRCLDLGVPAFTFFWDVVPEVVDRVKHAGCQVLHQVGTVDAARMAEEAGADVIIAQGSRRAATSTGDCRPSNWPSPLWHKRICRSRCRVASHRVGIWPALWRLAQVACTAEPPFWRPRNPLPIPITRHELSRQPGTTPF